MRIGKRAAQGSIVSRYELKLVYVRTWFPPFSTMMLCSSLLVLLGLVQLGTSKTLLKRWNNLALKHAWPEVPHGWEHTAPAPSNYLLELRIGLKQDRIDDLIDNLMEISDPANPRYIACLLLAFIIDQYSDIHNI